MRTDIITIDRIKTIPNGTILYRTVTTTEVDGVVVDTAYHRTSIAPIESIESKPDMIKAIALPVRTPENIAAYRASLNP